MSEPSLLAVYDVPTEVFVDTFHALAVDGLKAGVRVVAARPEHIGAAGLPEFGLAIGPDGDPCEQERPLAHPPSASLVLDLGRRGQAELEAHARVMARLAGVPSANPLPGSLRADRKHIAHELWRQAGLPTPQSWLIGSPDDLVCLLAEGPVYVLPDVGTEGVGVARFGAGQAKEAVAHAAHMLAEGPCVVRQAVGGPPEDRQVVLRIHVAWDGGDFEPESGFAVTASPTYPHVASVGREGLIGYIHALGLDWMALGVCSFAREAARALNHGLAEQDMLKFVGLDVLWDPRPDANEPLALLEANARPAGLSHSIWLSSPERPGVTAALFRWVHKA